MVDCRLIGIEFDGASEISFRFCPIPVILQGNQTQGRVRFTGLIVDSQRLQGCRIGQRKNLVRRRKRIISEPDINKGQTRISIAITGIMRDRRLEMFHGFPKALRGSLIVEEAALQVFFVNLRVNRA